MAIADTDHMLPFHPTNTIIIDIAKRKKNHDEVEKQKQKQSKTRSCHFG
jgi:hypothetical protein